MTYRTVHLSSWTSVAVALAGLMLSCRGGEPGAGLGLGGGGQVLTDDTVLACPNPEGLPFAVEANGFTDPDAAAIAGDNSRNKDSAADVLGIPDGVRAYTSMAVAAEPATGPMIFEGKKARTTPTSGLISTGLGNEPVSLWRYDPEGTTWNMLGRTSTDSVGEYSFSVDTDFEDVLRPAYAVLEADRTCAPHYGFLMAADTKVIITDIDGTLTLSDDELLEQIGDDTHVPAQNESATLLMTTWADKGYQVVYLTARPHAFRSETRAWLDDEGFPVGPVITANELVFGESARTYKRTWVGRIVNDFAWEVAAAYGNATSDIDAYEDAGIPKDITFIIGENAGVSGTQPIDGNDFGSHITDYVEQQPDA